MGLKIAHCYSHFKRLRFSNFVAGYTGVNDLFVGMMSAIGALSAGVILGMLGWGVLHLIALFFTLVLMGFFVLIAPSLRDKAE